MLDNLGYGDMSSLHQMFLSPGFTLLEKLLQNQMIEATKAAFGATCTAEDDIKLLNNLRGSNDVLETIATLRDEVSSRMKEEQQLLLYPERDNHSHPWIADGDSGKNTFIR